jgi:hypothetical protein
MFRMNNTFLIKKKIRKASNKMEIFKQSQNSKSQKNES